jgi:hypothetical protein
LGFASWGPPPPLLPTIQTVCCLYVCLLSVCLSASFPVLNLHDLYCWKFQYMKAIWKQMWTRIFHLTKDISYVWGCFSILLPLWLHNIFMYSRYSLRHSVSPVTFWDFDRFRLQVNKNPAIVHVYTLQFFILHFLL